MRPKTQLYRGSLFQKLKYLQMPGRAWGIDNCLYCFSLHLSLSYWYLWVFTSETIKHGRRSVKMVQWGFNSALVLHVHVYVGWICCWFSFLRAFFSRFTSLPPSTKTNISKFQFDQDRRLAWKPAEADVAPSLNIVIQESLPFFQQSWLTRNCTWTYDSSPRFALVSVIGSEVKVLGSFYGAVKQ